MPQELLQVVCPCAVDRCTGARVSQKTLGQADNKTEEVL